MSIHIVKKSLIATEHLTLHPYTECDEEDEDEYRGIIHKCHYCEKEL